MAKYTAVQNPLVGVANAGPWQDPNALGTYESGGQTYNTSLGDLPYLKLAAEMGLDVNALNNQLAGSDQANAPRSFDLNRAYSDAALQYLQSQGLTPKVAVQGSNIFTGLFDADGNLVNYDKHDTGEDARADLRGAATIAGMALGANYLIPPGLEQAAAAAGSSIVAPTAAELAAQTGLTQAGINATLPSLGAAGGAAGAAAGAGGYNLAAGQTAADVYGTEAAAGLTPEYVAATGASAAPAAESASLWSTLSNADKAFVVGAGLTAGNALLQNYTAGKAAQAQADANNNAISEQRRQYDQTRTDYAPWREAGSSALQTLQGPTGIDWAMTPEAVMSEPGYQFGQQQGQLALDRKQAALGGRAGGAALKAAARYNSDYATTRYDAAYQRRQDRLNRLQALAGLGQTATAGTAQAGANATNQISGLLNDTGSTAAGSYLARGNIWGNAANQIGAQLQRNPNALASLFGSRSSSNIWAPGYDDTFGATGGWTGQH